MARQFRLGRLAAAHVAADWRGNKVYLDREALGCPVQPHATTGARLASAEPETGPQGGGREPVRAYPECRTRRPVEISSRVPARREILLRGFCLSVGGGWGVAQAAPSQGHHFLRSSGLSGSWTPAHLPPHGGRGRRRSGCHRTEPSARGCGTPARRAGGHRHRFCRKLSLYKRHKSAKMRSERDAGCAAVGPARRSGTGDKGHDDVGGVVGPNPGSAVVKRGGAEDQVVGPPRVRIGVPSTDVMPSILTHEKRPSPIRSLTSASSRPRSCGYTSKLCSPR